jgi:hypothetical protein
MYINQSTQFRMEEIINSCINYAHLFEIKNDCVKSVSKQHLPKQEMNEPSFSSSYNMYHN